MKFLSVMSSPEEKNVPIFCRGISSEAFDQSEDNAELAIGGFQKQSLIDYPGLISAVVFTQGCNFKCVYCHNRQLIPVRENTYNNLMADEIISWTEKNKSMLDAVCITGGEPTIHPQIPHFIKSLKKTGLKIKLDTNGSNPYMLKKLTDEGLLDYIAIDVKTKLNLPEYAEITGVYEDPSLIQKLFESIKIIRKAENIEYEFRITLTDNYHCVKDLIEIVAFLKEHIVFQNFRHVEGVTPLSLMPFREFGELELLFNSYKVSLRNS